MGVADIQKGTGIGPIRVLLYGPEGIGKTTFAAGAPNPVFIGAEDGFGLLDVARFPEPKSWDEVISDVVSLRVENHDYKTLVLDTIDWLEPLCYDYVCKVGGKASIEDFPYGKGYVSALEQWRALVAEIERLRKAKGMNIIALAHAKVSTFANPVGENFNHYTLKCNEKTAGLFREYCDCVLFANLRVEVEKKKAVGAERVIYTSRGAAFEAKNRFDLPEVLPLSWEDFYRPIHSAKTTGQLMREILELAKTAPADVADRAVKYAEQNANKPNVLLQIVNKLKEVVTRQANSQPNTVKEVVKEAVKN